MNTIDNIMALADDYAEEYSSAMVPQIKQSVIDAREALRTALTEALEAQPENPAWRCTAQGLKRHLTQTQYDAQTDKIKAWYEPFSCEECKYQAAQPVRDPLQDSLAWELWLNAVDTANNTGRLVAYTYKEAIERANNIRGEK